MHEYTFFFNVKFQIFSLFWLSSVWPLYAYRVVSLCFPAWDLLRFLALEVSFPHLESFTLVCIQVPFNAIYCSLLSCPAITSILDLLRVTPSGLQASHSFFSMFSSFRLSSVSPS